MRKPRSAQGEPRDENKPAISTSSRRPPDRLAELRQTFESAIERLEAIPETELSPSGRPYIKECADAMLAFAAWFGEQTPEDVSIIGNAYRVCYAFGGLAGVIDWVSLHRSVPFANEIEQDAADLSKEAEAFDLAVTKAYTVTKTPNKIQMKRRPLPARTYDRITEKIERISSRAFALGIRLQRLAAWAPEADRPAQMKAQCSPEATRKPEPATQAVANHVSRAIIEIGPPGEPCYVRSKEKKPLTDGQRAVVSRLLGAGGDGMSKDALEAVRPSARRILKTLRKDRDWASVILMPGQTNGRYRLKM